MTTQKNANGPCITMEARWQAFGPAGVDEPLPSLTQMNALPRSIHLGERSIEGEPFEPVMGQYEFTPMFGPLHGPDTAGKVVYVYIPVHATASGKTTLGLGGDTQVQAWLNGRMILQPSCHSNWPPSFHDFPVNVEVDQGRNMLVVRLLGGKGSALLAVAGPDELAACPPPSILTDPFFQDPRWISQEPHALPGDKEVLDLGQRLEPFVDSLLIDGKAGDVQTRLHAPVPKEPVLLADQPWEASSCNYFSVLRDHHQGGIKLYYSARPKKVNDEDKQQFACVALSDDGIHFHRPTLGLIPYQGSTANNIVLQGTPGHNFSPFLDTNPDAKTNQLYKAIAYHPQGKGLGVYSSADGLNWQLMHPDKVIHKGDFDSHNLAFWDTHTCQYLCYYRDNTGGLRRIVRATSPDFIHWSAGEELTYTDSRIEHMYTNGIFPSPGAPHLYLALANRYVPQRTKNPNHPYPGLNDTVLMTSRDGRRFHRFEEGFIRPSLDWQNWTDRNLYVAWGVLETTPGQLSLYWTEHYRHPTARLMRGCVRRDGFASLHAGGEQLGEIITRPLAFSGNELTINFTTSAVGSIRIGLCEADGSPIAGHTMRDCEVLFGNELAHAVRWNCQSNLASLMGKPIRLRIRLHDADLYSMKFNRLK